MSGVLRRGILGESEADFERSKPTSAFGIDGNFTAWYEIDMDVTLTLRMDQGTLRALEAEAEALNTPKTALARRLIVDGLARRRSGGPVARVAYAGCVEGPGHSATNASVRRRFQKKRPR